MKTRQEIDEFLAQKAQAEAAGAPPEAGTPEATPRPQGPQRLLAGPAGEVPAAAKPAMVLPEPPAPGFVRFYHGGEEPTTGGGRWLTPDPEYARDSRRGETPNAVSYVDIPADSPLLKKSFDDTGTNVPRSEEHTSELQSQR